MRANLSSVKFIVTLLVQTTSLVSCSCGATSLTDREDDVFMAAQEEGLIWRIRFPIFLTLSVWTQLI